MGRDEYKLKCPICGELCAETGRGWKRHMTAQHQGYTPEQYQTALTEAGGEEGAAAMGGARNFEEAAGAAPATDRVEGTEPGAAPKRTRRTKDEMAQAESRNVFAREMAQILCNSMARRPYNAIAWALAKPEFALTDEEAEPIVAAYKRLVEVFGVEFVSKWWALIAVIDANVEAVEKRFPMLREVLFPSPKAKA